MKYLIHWSLVSLASLSSFAHAVDDVEIKECAYLLLDLQYERLPNEDATKSSLHTIFDSAARVDKNVHFIFPAGRDQLVIQTMNEIAGPSRFVSSIETQMLGLQSDGLVQSQVMSEDGRPITDPIPTKNWTIDPARAAAILAHARTHVSQDDEQSMKVIDMITAELPPGAEVDVQTPRPAEAPWN